MAKEKTPRFPDYKWYCVACHECISDQVGFDDNKFTWKCTHCNYKNSISKDNLRKPYAFLIDQSPKNKLVGFFAGVVRSVYGFLFRVAFCFWVAEIIIVNTHMTSIDHLSLGTISPRGIEDYFCAALYMSGIILLGTLVVYALFKKLVGRPDTKKHFLRETLFFVRDNLLYPVKTIKSLFKKTTIMDTTLSVTALLLLVSTIAFIAYGCLNYI